jgi:hypothetical protein
MKAGDVVKNKIALRSNSFTKGSEIPCGTMGIVIELRPDTLNNPPLMNYVDVMIAHDGEDAWCGNYAEGCFEVVV